MIEVFCTEKEAGLSALELLQRRWPAAPASYLRQLLRKGKVQRYGESIGEEVRVRAGDQLRLPDSRRLLELQALGALDILFESRDLLVVDKPAGVAVHRSAGHETDNLGARVEALVRRRGEPFRTAPAHRLDAGTSGPVIFGKGRQATAALGRLFMAGAVEKEYLALVAGPLAASGRLDSPVPAKGRWKAAVTDWRSLETRGHFSLLLLTLHSGRTHQIRRQLAEAGHPIAGDRRYGGPAVAGLEWLFLHARRIAFDSPFDDSRLEIASPLPAELAAVMASLPPGSQP